MLDIGWPELMVIGAMTVIVVGPKELPRVLRTVNQYVRKIRGMAGEFQGTIEDMARQADLDDLKQQMTAAKGKVDDFTSLDVEDKINSIADPDADLGNTMKDLNSSVKDYAETLKNSANAEGDDDTDPTGVDEAKPVRQEGASASSVDETSDASKNASAVPSEPAAKKSTAKKTRAKKATAKKASAKKSAAKKTAAKKAAAKSAPDKDADDKAADGSSDTAG